MEHKQFNVLLIALFLLIVVGMWMVLDKINQSIETSAAGAKTESASSGTVSVLVAGRNATSTGSGTVKLVVLPNNSTG